MTRDMPEKPLELPPAASWALPAAHEITDTQVSAADELALMLVEDPHAIETKGDRDSPLDSDVAYPALPPVSARMAAVRPAPEGYTPRGRMMLALVGALALQALLPGLLLFMNGVGTLFVVESDHLMVDVLDLLSDMIVRSMAFGAPLALIFAVGLMAKMRDCSRVPVADEGPLMYAGLLLGALLGCANIPMLGLAEVLELNSATLVRLALMMMVTGASTGAWIGYQAYAERYTRKSWWPRFSLRTLLLLVIGWGLLVGIYLPR